MRVFGECKRGHGPKWWRYSDAGNGWCVICNNENHRKRYHQNKTNASGLDPSIASASSPKTTVEAKEK